GRGWRGKRPDAREPETVLLRAGGEQRGGVVRRGGPLRRAAHGDGAPGDHQYLTRRGSRQVLLRCGNCRDAGRVPYPGFIAQPENEFWGTRRLDDAVWRPVLAREREPRCGPALDSCPRVAQ